MARNEQQGDVPAIDVSIASAQPAAASRRTPAEGGDYGDKDAWYIIPSNSLEQEAGMIWAERNLAEDQLDFVVSELPLGRLHKRSIVYFLGRKPKGRTGKLRDTMPITGHIGGEAHHRQILAEELVEDFEAHGPIVVADYWTGTDKWKSNLDIPSFNVAIAQLALPWTRRWLDANNRKGGETGSTIYFD